MRTTSSAILAGWISLTMALGPSGCTPAPQTTRADTTAAAAPVGEAMFARLKTLVGEWQGTIAGDSFPALATISLTARETAIIERIVIQDPVEMTTVYHMEGDRLVLTHYCAAGNQPRMVLARTTRGDSLRFDFLAGANLDERRDLHMRSKELILTGPNELRMVWETFTEGHSVSRDTIVMRRRV